MCCIFRFRCIKIWRKMVGLVRVNILCMHCALRIYSAAICIIVSAKKTSCGKRNFHFRDSIDKTARCSYIAQCSVLMPPNSNKRRMDSCSRLDSADRNGLWRVGQIISCNATLDQIISYQIISYQVRLYLVM